VTGRTTHDQQSEYARPETIEETAELVSASGGNGIAVDHLVADEVSQLVDRIRSEQGRLDVLVNDLGRRESQGMEHPVWKHDLQKGLRCSAWAFMPNGLRQEPAARRADSESGRRPCDARVLSASAGLSIAAGLRAGSRERRGVGPASQITPVVTAAGRDRRGGEQDRDPSDALTRSDHWHTFLL
jgi:NAD(P)-dependent dehydrogenase (short-subunit alcohol dehydrogenase family)